MNCFYITGTGRGIGKAIAEELLTDAENTVIGISRTQGIRSKNYIHHRIDLSSSEKISAFQFGEHPLAKQIVLINNAGSLGEVTHLGNLNNNEIAKAFNLNVTAPAILMNGFIKDVSGASGKKAHC